MKRCKCVNENNKLYVHYHDNEWGVPNYDDNYMFEFLILESFQAGLSWETILNKRENFRQAFDNFDYKKVANYDENKINELIQNKGIIRNKLKIKAAINNAKIFMEIQKEFNSFSNYIWSFTNCWPLTMETVDEKGKETFYIVGETQIQEGFKTKYRIGPNKRKK